MTKKPKTHPGWCEYADILKSLMLLPGTNPEMSARFGMSYARMRIILNRFHDLGVIHVGGWKKRDCVITGAAMAVFHFGKGTDAPGVANGPRSRKPRKLTAQHEQTQMVHVMRLLVDPITKNDLAAASGSSQRTICKFVNHLHSIGMCHIHAWSQQMKGGSPAAMWQLGNARDARRPEPLSSAQLSRNAWERRKERNAMQRLIKATASNASVFTWQPATEAA